MFVDQSELDTDLEWMLQSGQADDQAIIVALVKEFYPTIFRFALSILGVYQEARSAAVESLATALVESHRYSGMEGAHLWLFSIAATVCSKAYKKSPKLQKGMTLSSQDVQSVVDQDAMPQSLHQVNYWSAIDSLPLDQRLPVLLRVVCELSVAEIAVVLSEREKTITSQLQVSYRQIAAKNHTLDPSQKISIDSGFEKTLSTSLQSDWPLTSSSATENEQIKAEVQTKVQVLRRKSQSRIRIQEISVIGLVMVVVVVLVGIVNSLQSAQDDILPPSPTSQQTPLLFQGNRTAIPTHLATIDHATSPTPISPVISLQPLDLHSTADEVNQRILKNTSTWQSLWADVIFYFYGPRGYIGPPVVSRHQVWIVRDESALIISGPLDSKPESSTLETLSRYASSNNVGLRNVSFRNPISWWQFTNDDWIISPTMYRLFVFREMILEHQSALQILRASAELPGFVALVVDQLGGDGERIARLWVDVKTGLPLRERLYDERDPETVILDVVVNSLAIDEVLPSSLFEDLPDHPLRDHFAADFSGQVELTSPRQRQFLVDPLAWRVSRTSPLAPPDFNPSKSHLAFEVVDESRDSGITNVGMLVFADDYLLAELPPEHPLVFNPLSITCTRSPDGSILAFRDFLTFIEEPPLQQPYKWLRLADMSKVYTTQEKESSYYSSIIFSPDSRHLAMTISEHQAASSPPPPPPPDNQGIPSPAFPRHELHLIDTSTGETQKIDVLMKVPPEGDEGSPLQEDRLISVETVLFWSPDGRYILGSSPDVGAALLAIEVSSGIAIPGEFIDFQFPFVQFSFPELDWQGEFEFLFLNDLSGCVEPPGE